MRGEHACHCASEHASNRADERTCGCVYCVRTCLFTRLYIRVCSCVHACERVRMSGFALQQRELIRLQLSLQPPSENCVI